MISQVQTYYLCPQRYRTIKVKIVPHETYYVKSFDRISVTNYRDFTTNNVSKHAMLTWIYKHKCDVWEWWLYQRDVMSVLLWYPVGSKGQILVGILNTNVISLGPGLSNVTPKHDIRINLTCRRYVCYVKSLIRAWWRVRTGLSFEDNDDDVKWCWQRCSSFLKNDNLFTEIFT